MKIGVYVMHVPGIPSRDESLRKLLERVPEAIVMSDPERLGVWFNARRCWAHGVESDYDWIIVLNDDALPCDGFLEVAEKALSSRSDMDPVCFYVNHPKAAEQERVKGGTLLTCGWYTTYDGLVGVGCALSVDAASDFLRWEDEAMVPSGYPDDARINLWAMATGRLIHTTVPSLVDHQLPNESMTGNEDDDARKALVPPQPKEIMIGVNWDTPPRFFGRMYQTNHLMLLEYVSETLTEELIERYMDIERGHGRIVDGRPRVFIAAPTYDDRSENEWHTSVMKECRDLQENGIDVQLGYLRDSSVDRVRDRLVAEFLRSDCTHLLFWDTDNFPTRTGWAKVLLDTGHDFVGGPVVLKDGSGTKFAMQFDGHGKLDLPVVNGCIAVRSLGTGFVMLSRKAIIKMIIANHPKAYYYAGAWMNGAGRAEWALYQNTVRNKERLTEDYEVCQKWRDIGGTVYMHPEMEFVHVGRMFFHGSFWDTHFKGQ